MNRALEKDDLGIILQYGFEILHEIGVDQHIVIVQDHDIPRINGFDLHKRSIR
jgi:hypothetical protein